MNVKVKISVVLYAIFLSISFCSFGDEGMWWPQLLEKMNYAEMKGMGCKLTAEEIYSVNHSSLKDAVVSLGGCTGEIVSSRGLMLTNHHCGYGRIAELSSVEHDYLKNGFWAMSFNEELPAKGMFVRFLISIEDVTEKVTEKMTSTMTEAERQDAAQKIFKIITDEVTKGTTYTAEVKGSFFNNKFYLFIYETYNDVRLVGAPPSAIGKFGGDTDNWMWPRHTSDFSIFRIYTDPNGKPANYSPDNIPMVPKKFLPVSLNGYNENDFAMVMGFPGRTNRYLSSYGVKTAYEYTNPAIVKIREKKLAIMSDYMKKSDAVRIMYSSKYAGTANYWKYFIGQNKGILRLNVIAEKQKEENEFLSLTSSLSGMEKYKNSLELVENAYKQLPEYLYVFQYLNEAFWRGSDIVGFAARFQNLFTLLTKDKPDTKEIQAACDKLKPTVSQYFENINIPTEQDILSAMLEMYTKDVDKKYHPDFFSVLSKKYKNDYIAFSKMVFTKSIFAQQQKLNAFLNKPSAKILEKDPAFIIYRSVAKVTDENKKKREELMLIADEGMRLYMEANLKLHPERKYYADANSTMRLTYGKVIGYNPADAVTYRYYTTLSGVMDKDNPNSDEFNVPQKLKDLYKAKDFGRYADANGEIRTCFLTNLDITGGNSGSPVINGKGELIGLAFDGNWESMSGDIKYEPDLQRCIGVDIRYVLFIIDKFAGAGHLVDEMDIR